MIILLAIIACILLYLCLRQSNEGFATNSRNSIPYLEPRVRPFADGDNLVFRIVDYNYPQGVVEWFKDGQKVIPAQFWHDYHNMTYYAIFYRDGDSDYMIKTNSNIYPDVYEDVNHIKVDVEKVREHNGAYYWKLNLNK
jgi:hypothetical protein